MVGFTIVVCIFIVLLALAIYFPNRGETCGWGHKWSIWGEIVKSNSSALDKQRRSCSKCGMIDERSI